MHKFGHAVVRLRVPILIIAVLLLIPSYFGYVHTRINYDMLDYLPDSMDTVAGQNILKDDFGKGAFSLIVTEGMTDKQVADLTDDIKGVDHVADALSYGSIADPSIPDQLIPSEISDNFKNGDDQLIAVFFDSGTSSDDTMQAVTQIRDMTDEHVLVSGMSAMVTDLKNIAEREEPSYVLVAVLCSIVALLLLTNSFAAPFVFLISIGMAIIYNLGSNFFLGQVSYITKALAAVLQLAVTMDYSIFLWNSFIEKLDNGDKDLNHAMGEAIGDTLVSISSSACTACAGFLAMCFMTYKLGADLGIVMAKGCLFGLVASITILPALLLVFHKVLLKTRHRSLIPRATHVGRFVTSHPWAFILVFCIVLVPALYGFSNKPVYYDFTNTLTGSDSHLEESDIRFHTADMRVQDDFDVATTEMVLCDSNLSHAEAKEMTDRVEDVDGVKYALGYDSFVGGMLPDSLVPSDLKDSLKHDPYQLIIINSSYLPSTDAVNAQIDQINDIIKDYDPNAMLIGEAPATKDLISTTNHDFMVVDAVAIIAVLVILFFVFRSATLPFILVAVIEFAIFINLGIPYYTNDVMSFITPICISTIQLGSCVNYAILLTTRYRKERREGLEKRDAISTAVATSLPAVVASAVSFFAATFGVKLYANIGIISQLTGIMSRGALISMVCVLFILPAFLMVFDGAIVKTSHGFKPKKTKGDATSKSVVPTKEVSA
jgi:predicted RND superfamily exporter protein